MGQKRLTQNVTPVIFAVHGYLVYTPSILGWVSSRALRESHLEKAAYSFQCKHPLHRERIISISLHQEATADKPTLVSSQTILYVFLFLLVAFSLHESKSKCYHVTLHRFSTPLPFNCPQVPDGQASCFRICFPRYLSPMLSNTFLFFIVWARAGRYRPLAAIIRMKVIRRTSWSLWESLPEDISNIMTRKEKVKGKAKCFLMAKWMISCAEISEKELCCCWKGSLADVWIKWKRASHKFAFSSFLS